MSHYYTKIVLTNLNTSIIIIIINKLINNERYKSKSSIFNSTFFV